jgi:EmrB/QacA subfamily drug resistance transporter
MTRNSPRAVLALTGTALFMIVLDNLIVASALPSIERSLNSPISSAEWILDAYILSFAVLILTGAALGERFGRRRVFVAGLVIFTAASAAGALAASVGELVAARAVQGAGSAILMPLTLTLLTNAFPAEKRGTALGIWSSIAGLGVAAGPLVGGAITDALSWHWIFWINVPVGVAAIVLSPRLLEESYGRREPIDLAGLLLVSTGLLGVVYATVRGNAAGWLSASTVSAYVAGTLLLVAFVAYELRKDHPMLPMRLFRSARFSVSNATGFLLHFAMFGAFLMVIQFLVEVRGESPVMSGVWTLPWTIMPFAISPIAGRIGQRTNPALPAAVGMGLLGLGTLELATELSPSTTPLGLAPALVAIGVGIGLTLPNLAALAMGSVPAADIGKASGTLSTIRQLGGAFGVALTVAAFARAGSHATPLAFSQGFAAATGVAAVLSLAGAGAGLLLPGRRTRRRGAGEDGAYEIEKAGTGFLRKPILGDEA